MTAGPFADGYRDVRQPMHNSMDVMTCSDGARTANCSETWGSLKLDAAHSVAVGCLGRTRKLEEGQGLQTLTLGITKYISTRCRSARTQQIHRAGQS